MAPRIQYIKHAAIDSVRWDACIHTADNARIYATAAYLDAMCPGWDALVAGDYEAVFPLPRRNKWGVTYAFYPFLAGQLGLFGKALSGSLLEAFLQAIPASFRYIDIPLNSGNNFKVSFPLVRRVNYLLPLHPPYNILEKAYRETTRRNIRKAEKLGCIFKKDFPVKKVIELARFHTKEEQGMQQFSALYEKLHARGSAMTYGIHAPTGNLIASAVFLLYGERAYYILVGNHPNGRTLGASHMLIDAFIRDHAGTNITLDFEGSDLRNLAFFYSSFGAVEEFYPALRWNRLPFFLKWFRK